MVEKQGEGMRLVKNWKKLHKSFTVILSFLGFLVSMIEIILPQMGLIQPFLDPATYGTLMFVMTIAIGIGRYVQQDSVKGDVSDDISSKEGQTNDTGQS